MRRCSTGRHAPILETVERLGFLQIDPISTVAPPQQLVLWSRLGAYDVAELERLLWVDRKLFEWNAYIWPIESLPLVRARMRRRRDKYAWERRGNEFLKTECGLPPVRAPRARTPRPAARARARGSLGLEARHAPLVRQPNVAIMLEILHGRGIVAIVGRRGGQRLWDLAERWYPETDTVPLAEADRLLDEQRFRALGVRLVNGDWHAHPEADDSPVPATASRCSRRSTG